MMNKALTIFTILLAIPMSSCSLVYDQVSTYLPLNKNIAIAPTGEESITKAEGTDTINGEHACELGGSMLIENYKGIQSYPTIIYRGEVYSMSPYTHPTQNFKNFVDSNLSGAELLIGSSVYFVIKATSGETIESCRSTGVNKSKTITQQSVYPITCYVRTSDGSPIKEYSMLNPPLINNDSIPMTDGSVVEIHRFVYGSETGIAVFGLQKPYGPNSSGTWLPGKDLKRVDGEPCNSGFTIVRRRVF